MGFLKNTLSELKKMPKAVLVAAIIVPGGVSIVGAYLLAKTFYDKTKNK